MSAEREPNRIERLPEFYVPGGEEVELDDLAQVNVPEKGDDVPENPHRRTQRAYEHDLGPLGKASFIRGEYPGEDNPDRGKWYETWTMPGELRLEAGELGEVTLTKVRTGSNRQSDTQGGAESSWGDGEFASLGIGAPDLAGLEPISSTPDEKSGKTTDVFDLGGGRMVYRETAEGQNAHVYERRTFPGGGPSVELQLPRHGGEPNQGERPLVTMRLTVDRIEANLDTDRDPAKPMGRVKFRVERLG